MTPKAMKSSDSQSNRAQIERTFVCGRSARSRNVFSSLQAFAFYRYQVTAAILCDSAFPKIKLQSSPVSES
jgi:hypothetical protein